MSELKKTVSWLSMMTLTDVDMTGMSTTSVCLTCWLEPSHMTRVSVALTRNLLALIQSFTSVMQAAKPRTDAAVLPDADTYVNLTCWCSGKPCRLTTWLSSAMYKTCSRGPRTDPCRMPNNSDQILDSWPLNICQCCSWYRSDNLQKCYEVAAQLWFCANRTNILAWLIDCIFCTALVILCVILSEMWLHKSDGVFSCR